MLVDELVHFYPLSFRFMTNMNQHIGQGKGGDSDRQRVDQSGGEGDNKVVQGRVSSDAKGSQDGNKQESKEAWKAVNPGRRSE